MKTVERLTKQSILLEISTLREKINTYCAMGLEDLQSEYDRAFPAHHGQKQSKAECIRGLLMSATYYMSNVLDLE